MNADGLEASALTFHCPTSPTATRCTLGTGTEARGFCSLRLGREGKLPRNAVACRGGASQAGFGMEVVTRCNSFASPI